MENTALCKNLWLFLFFASTIIGLRGEEASKGVVRGQNNDPSSTKTGPPQMKDMSVGNGEKTHNEVVVKDKKRSDGGGGGGGGGVGWGWGGGGGGANENGSWGWGNGGGGGVAWRWGCQAARKRVHRKRSFYTKGDFKIGEFAQCTIRGRCMGMRLDCPLHCGGPCFYDCRHMCKAHCRR